jgi:hypothetical protein
MRPIGHIYELEDGTFQIVNEPMPRWRLMDILLQLTRGLAAQAAEVDAAAVQIEAEPTGRHPADADEPQAH